MLSARRRRFIALVAALAPVVAGCAFLGPAPAPVASDALVPSTLRTAIGSAREALQEGWQGPDGVTFRFDHARCAIGAEVALAFEQRAPGTPDAWALAMARDIAAGALFGAWRLRYDVPDPAAEPTLIELIGDQEIVCP